MELLLTNWGAHCDQVEGGQITFRRTVANRARTILIVVYTSIIATQTEIEMKVFTLMGYTVTNADQARSILVVATLKGNKPVAEQCRSVIKQFEA